MSKSQQKTDQPFWRGLGGRSRHPIGGLGENPPILDFPQQTKLIIDKYLI